MSRERVAGAGWAEETGECLAPVLRHLSVGVALTVGGSIAAANPALARMAGAQTAEDLIGKPVEALWIDAGDGIPAPGDAGVLECRLRGLDGDVTPVQVRCLSEAAGARTWWLVEPRSAAPRDDAERVHLGRALHEAQRRVAALEEQAREREQLLCVVSHELRTPVTVMSGYLRLLLSEQVGRLELEQRRFADESLRACGRMQELIERLLDSARRGEAGVALEQAPISLAELVRGVERAMRPLLDERGLQLDLELASDAEQAWCDASRVEQVLSNLLANAIRYAQHGVRVMTRPLVSADGRRAVEVSVEDDGPGIPQAERSRIFEPWVRAGRDRGCGVGLGLAICRRLVEEHGGEISAGDAPAGGARLAFSLPATEEDGSPGASTPERSACAEGLEEQAPGAEGDA